MPLKTLAGLDSLNRSLGGTLEADCEALREDLRHAAEVFAESQRQLADKSQEAQVLQNLLQKSSTDLATLQTTIAELRKERHFLANELMRAAELEIRMTELTEERDGLSQELQKTKEALQLAEEKLHAL